MQIRMANWNVNRRADLRSHWELLDSLGWDVCTLQEVGPGTAAAVAGAEGLESSHALDHVGATAALVAWLTGPWWLRVHPSACGARVWWQVSRRQTDLCSHGSAITSSATSG